MKKIYRKLGLLSFVFLLLNLVFVFTVIADAQISPVYIETWNSLNPINKWAPGVGVNSYFTNVIPGSINSAKIVIANASVFPDMGVHFSVALRSSTLTPDIAKWFSVRFTDLSNNETTPWFTLDKFLAPGGVDLGPYLDPEPVDPAVNPTNGYASSSISSLDHYYQVDLLMDQYAPGNLADFTTYLHVPDASDFDITVTGYANYIPTSQDPNPGGKYLTGMVSATLDINHLGFYTGDYSAVVPTDTPTLTPTPTDIPSPTPTDTPVPTDTPAPTDTPYPTDIPSPTPTLTPVPTDTPVPTNTPVPSATPTNTPVPTKVPTPTPTPVPQLSWSSLDLQANCSATPSKTRNWTVINYIALKIPFTWHTLINDQGGSGTVLPNGTVTFQTKAHDFLPQIVVLSWGNYFDITINFGAKCP